MPACRTASYLCYLCSSQSGTHVDWANRAQRQTDNLSSHLHTPLYTSAYYKCFIFSHSHLLALCPVTLERPGPSSLAHMHGLATPLQLKEEGVISDRARARQEWNKARAEATTSEIFKAMSRTGAGGDAYFALVALFCTADKMVVPVHCRESPVKVDFYHSPPGKTGVDADAERRRTGQGDAGETANTSRRNDIRVVVTVPSTFDIYLRDGRHSTGGGGNSGAGGGPNAMRRTSSAGSRPPPRRKSLETSMSECGGADASAAQHLVRLRAVVVEEIWALGSRWKSAARRGDVTIVAGTGNEGGSRAPSNDEAGMAALPPLGTPEQATPPLMRTARRMKVSIVPEPSPVTSMMRQFSRRVGVNARGPSPPRTLGR